MHGRPLNEASGLCPVLGSSHEKHNHMTQAVPSWKIKQTKTTNAPRNKRTALQFRKTRLWLQSYPMHFPNAQRKTAIYYKLKLLLLKIP